MTCENRSNNIKKYPGKSSNELLTLSNHSKYQKLYVFCNAQSPLTIKDVRA